MDKRESSLAWICAHCVPVVRRIFFWSPRTRSWCGDLGDGFHRARWRYICKKPPISRGYQRWWNLEWFSVLELFLSFSKKLWDSRKPISQNAYGTSTFNNRRHGRERRELAWAVGLDDAFAHPERTVLTWREREKKREQLEVSCEWWPDRTLMLKLPPHHDPLWAVDLDDAVAHPERTVLTWREGKEAWAAGCQLRVMAWPNFNAQASPPPRPPVGCGPGWCSRSSGENSANLERGKRSVSGWMSAASDGLTEL